ncbi:serine/threonine-protein kinase [Nannocystis sp.]|uniref:serine/threonine-protein kinase n=1 Tax=Nannocystis sp. TaxID=1962667 RepID=UPI0025F9D950|nr:serine/threonine-protein kinase [Nannocystis sp.]MBK7825069.1 serine/threonine protein kinase [Nannocystis sp.]
MDPRDATLVHEAPSVLGARGQGAEEISMARTIGGSGSTFTRTPEEIGHGQLVGRYVVLNPLGAGGMGVVYAAYDPQLDRKVALKLLHSEAITRGGATQSRVDGHARLLREAQAMARLRHPNVVAVHDVGSYGDRVFIAMEFVEGSTLKSWLRARPRTRKEVLAVFIQAGRGLQAAHDAGLVHRDFKPENVLVSTAGQAQVLDFGLAKSTEEGGERADKPERSALELASSMQSLSRELTQQGAVMGTPAYMSPEQHLGLPTDARTDQFSFCVGLYEALYGTPPFPADTMASLAMAVVGGKVAEAPRESQARVPPWLRKVLLKGLSCDPTHRYATISELIDALARDPSNQRKRWLAVATGLGLLALAAVGYAQYLAQSSQRCADAEQHLAGVWDDDTRKAAHTAFLAAGDSTFAEDTWQRVARTLDSYTNGWVRVQTAACTATHIDHTQSVELLHLQNACLARRLSELRAVTAVFTRADAPVLERAVQMVAGLNDLRSCTDEDALTSAVVPPADVQTRAAVDGVRVQLDSARALERAGKYGPGLQTARVAAETARELAYAPVLAEALVIEGDLLFQSGKMREAEAALSEAVRTAAVGKHATAAAEAWIELIHLVGVEEAQPERGLAMRLAGEAAIAWAGDDTVLTARLLAAIGGVLHAQARFAEAIEISGRALALYEGLPADNETHARDLAIADVLAALGTTYNSKGEFEAADRYFRRALDTRRHTLGNDHPDVASSLHDLGNNDYRLARYDDAESHLGEALAIRTRVLGGQHSRVADTENSLGAVDYARGEFARARDHYQRALTIREQSLGPDHPNTAASWVNLGNAELMTEDLEGARANYEHALAIHEKTLGPDHPTVAYSLTNIGLVLRNQSKLTESLVYYQRALKIREQAFGPENPDVAYNLDNLGEIETEQGDLTSAVTHQERALQIREKTLGADHPLVATSLFNLGATLTRQRRYPEARERLTAALAIRTRALGPQHPDVAACLAAQSELERLAGGDATTPAERSLQIYEASSEALPQDVFEAKLRLAQALAVRKPTDRARARALALNAREGFAGLDPAEFASKRADADAVLAKLR